MAELPGSIWIIGGFIISGYSIFLEYVKKIDNTPFFRIMMFVGLGMILIGFIKSKFKNRSKNNMVDEMRKRHSQRNSGKPMQNQSQQTTHNQHQARPYHNPQQHTGKQTQGKFCHQCGVPLHKTQKFCAMCGARV